MAVLKVVFAQNIYYMFNFKNCVENDNRYFLLFFAGSFESRKKLPAAWRGLRDQELSTVSGIPGGVFVHAGGFIGGNDTYEGALAMAVKALSLD